MAINSVENVAHKWDLHLLFHVFCVQSHIDNTQRELIKVSVSFDIYLVHHVSFRLQDKTTGLN